jgi:polysaccharide export outer membrane protein
MASGLPLALLATGLGVIAPVLASPALAQATPGGATPSPLLSPPQLPSMLPGGIPVPALPPGVQQDILQRILDASGTGQGGAQQPGFPASLPQIASPARPLAMPAQPAPQLTESLSHTEAFYAARLEAPLRQFGYDTFREMTSFNSNDLG